MDARLKSLPAPIRTIAERIEDKCRCEIELRRSPPLFTGSQADCEGAATIEPQYRVKEPSKERVKDSERLRPIIFVFEKEQSLDTLIHELLHLDRWILEGVPQLTSTQPLFEGIPNREFVGTVGWIDNHIEHFHILRRMNEMGYPQAPRLDSIYRKDFDETLPVAIKFGRKISDLVRCSLFLRYATVRRFCEDAQVKATVEKVLTISGLLADAQSFDGLLEMVLPDKANTARFVAKALGIAPSILRLCYFNTRLGTFEYRRLS